MHFEISKRIEKTPELSNIITFTSFSISWYGPNCKYQCHCAGSAPCDRHDGSCSSGCEQGWFGAACQYGSIGFTLLGKSTQDWLTDQNDTTCNDDEETPVFLTLKSPIPLKWSRVVVSSPARLRDVKLFYYIEDTEESVECSGPKVNISDTVQDILCPTTDNVTRVILTINGEAGRGLCSLYLSTACAVGTHSASCWYSCSKQCGGLYNACDHMTGTCTDGCDLGYYGQKCLAKCSSSCARKDKECERFGGKCHGGCKAGYFGDKCKNKCNTINCTETNKACYRKNKRCMTGCDPGFYGDYCDEPCSKQCAGRLCDRNSGACVSGCEPGYTGANCSQGKIEVSYKRIWK
ncbi:hypothetical protein RRG08_036697 [Elysia crispata]|uniref:Uncharacterized protein n=1 Tax=Elysia crispata TaxID=231223 RepID=A0AAE0YV33_9GAST|nr:hypothetical protein RRG08_036697 [Elysia crispata]